MAGRSLRSRIALFGLACQAAGVLLLLVGCDRGGPSRPNVLLVSLDTVRSDHCSTYGYSRDTTPNLSKLASSGALFELAYAPSSTTAPTHATLFTSTHPTRHGVVRNGVELGEGLATLAEILGNAGFDTAGFVASFVFTERFGLSRGFERWDAEFDETSARLQLARWEGHDVTGGFDRPGAEVTDAALGWLDTRDERDRPFLLFAHYFDAHEPYVAPEPFRTRFAPPADASPTEAEIAAYDAGVATVDAELGRLLDGLEARGLAEETLVVVFGDHGQGLFDHGVRYHGRAIYEEQVRVPLAIRWPDRIATGRRLRSPVGLVDLLPTIADLIGLPKSGAHGSWQGRSLARVLLGRPSEEPPPPIFLFRRVYADGTPGVRGFQLGVRIDGWKYIEGIAEDRRELFDLAVDPAETVNLVDQRPRAAAAMARWLVPRRSEMEGVGRPADLSEEERARLRALGYAD